MELRSFLGAVQWCSRFIEDMCTMTQPLWKLTKKGAHWEWSEREQTAMEQLKAAITTNYMSFFNKEWDTEVVVDSSPVGLSAVLRQTNPQNPSDRKYVCFASRLLSDTETRYSQCEKEALAAFWGCERYWFYRQQSGSVDLRQRRRATASQNRAVGPAFNAVRFRDRSPTGQN